jgi:transposase
MENIEAEGLLADKGYDANEIIEQAEKQNMKPVIPPRKNRIIQRKFNKRHYKLRHWVENAFLHLKRWRGIATRYAKKASSFLAIVLARCILLWTQSRVDII